MGVVAGSRANLALVVIFFGGSVAVLEVWVKDLF